MTSTNHRPTLGESTVDDRSLPADLPPGATILVAVPDSIELPSLPLELLARYAAPEDCAICVTSRQGETAALEPTIEHLTREHVAGVGVVDTTAGERLTALYRPVPTVYTPVPGDIERTTVALSELQQSFPCSDRLHLSITSLSPIVEDVDRSAAAVLESFLTAIDRGDGVATVGLEYTRHDAETMDSLSAVVDGVVWVEPRSDGGLALEYRSARSRR